MTKRVLIGLSRAIERFALAADPADPLVVVALFQRSSYFAREAAVYRDIAARGAVTVVGLVEDFPPSPSPGVRFRPIAADDALAREWSVAVLGPHGGASLVAIDQESVDPDAPTLEHGRRFCGRWSFRRADAQEQVLRLRRQLRLPAATEADIEDVLQAVARVPEPPRQSWWEAPLRVLAQDVEQAVRRHDRVRAARPDELDGVTGLRTRAHLERWTAKLGPGTLPVGLVAVRLLDAHELRDRYGMRLELAAVQTVAAALGGLVDGADRLVQLNRCDFLFVLPSADPAEVAALGRSACARVARLEADYPFIGLRAAVSTVVTRDRPLPVAGLLDGLMRLEEGREPAT